MFPRLDLSTRAYFDAFVVAWIPVLVAYGLGVLTHVLMCRQRARARHRQQVARDDTEAVRRDAQKWNWFQ